MAGDGTTALVRRRGRVAGTGSGALPRGAHGPNESGAVPARRFRRSHGTDRVDGVVVRQRFSYGVHRTGGGDLAIR
jgi:hypothetical protein